MAEGYTFGELEDRIVDLMCVEEPDYVAVEELLKQGADINATNADGDESILSEIFEYGEWGNRFKDDQYENLQIKNYTVKEYKQTDPQYGNTMCEIIKFFLAHGFDVTKKGGCLGAIVLYDLALSSFDRYMIDATKLLIDAGAINRPITDDPKDRCETPWNRIGVEGSCMGTIHYDHALENIYESIYQIYQAIDEGRPHAGIDSFEAAIGKKIIKVLATHSGDSPVFYTIDQPSFKKANCYTSKLYFIYDEGSLITTQYADFWTDAFVPDTDLVDVSEDFNEIIGSTIKRFYYGHKSVEKNGATCGQPITLIEMNNGKKMIFSINFGEVEKVDRAAFFELI